MLPMPRRLRWFAFPLTLLLSVIGPEVRAGGDDLFIKPGETVLILGDSITQTGTYVDFIDAYLMARDPDRDHRLINIGLSSETASGLSEPNHPFPRPDVHDRLGRALERTDPDVVTACYGMNDGIYHPYSPSRFRAYRDGINRLIEKVQETGARLALITPPPYDPAPVMGKTVTADATQHGYKHPYRHYDTVLNLYAAWIMARRERVAGVVDLHTPLNRELDRRRRKDPGFALAGDGVHPGRFGHWLMARRILTAWNADAMNADTKAINGPDRLAEHLNREPVKSFFQLVDRRQRILSDAWRRYISHSGSDGSQRPPLNKARRQAAELEKKIRRMARSKALDLRLVPDRE